MLQLPPIWQAEKNERKQEEEKNGNTFSNTRCLFGNKQFFRHAYN